MISTKEIEAIFIKDLQELMDVSSIYVTDDIPDGKVETERMTIHVKPVQCSDSLYDKCYVEVNWAVPDNDIRPNHNRLAEVERVLVTYLDDDHVGEEQGTWYRYGVESHQVEKSELECHFVNVRVLFEILN